MGQIKIYGDIESSSIFFINSTVEPKSMGTIEASLKSDEDRIVIRRTDRFDPDGVSFRTIFRRLNPTRVQNRDGQDLVGTLGYTTQEVVDYINAQANLSSGNSGGDGTGTDLTGVSMGFKLDATSTSIMLDNGLEFGVNTIKAIDNGDGLISIVSELGDLTHFTKLDHTLVTGHDGNAVSGGLNDVINYLNELFTVGAFTSIVISDPYSTMVADVSGVDTSVSYVGYGLDPVGNDVYGSTSSNSQNGLKTTETINQAGEYFTFDIRVEGTIGFGLVHSQDSFDNGYYSGNSTYANPSTFGVSNSGHSGYQFSHWFHPTPNGSWTNYGANTGYSMRSGWSNFNGTDEQADWLAGNPIKVRVGIDSNSYISIETLRNGTDWVVHSRTSYPIVQGSEFHLGIKTNHTGARVFSLPKVHLLEEEAPIMTFRYIESPDGVFNYPLFTTAEEAEYYDKIVNGVENGSSHTHTYADDPTGTTWYMPEASHDASTYQHSSAPSGSETFEGNAVTYTEITSRTNADLTPPLFTQSDLTYQEGSVLNLQVTPAGASWSTSASISPTGSGLVFDGNSMFQGTLSDVASDTDYTVTVTRGNSYGSTTGSFTLTVTDVAPPQTNETPWTKALDFSGSNEHLKQVTSSAAYNAMRMTGIAQTVPNNFDSSRTSAGTYARPWMTSVVFKTDRNNSNQHIWNQGEGAGSNDDNIYLRTDSAGNLYFGWGRGANNNECQIAQRMLTSNWYGVYIAHKGGRFSSSNATSTNLADAFDIRIMGTYNNWTLGSNLSTSSNWINTGNRTDRTVSGDFTIGGRGSNRSFHGKVSSMIITTLKKDEPIPADSEIGLMITDPKKWEDDYRIGQTVRASNSDGESSYNPNQGVYGYYGTQIWLMGDGIYDSYANGIRNQVYFSDQNFVKLQLNSMVSNDIQTVNINGLT
ncbi:fiber Ig/hemolysin [uncultured Mediterranean phage uvMED]|nr:fiber Ig/hemolysin [uncultured Mediterranean phage uvMED]